MVETVIYVSQKSVEAYLRALNDHDLKKASMQLSDDVVMKFAGADYEIDKAQILGSRGWHKGTKAKFNYTVTAADCREVSITLTETNSFLELLDVPPFQARMEFYVEEDKLIHLISYEASGGTAADPGIVERALEPVIQWAREIAAEELDEIYPGGQIQYSRQSGERWVRLLNNWRKSREI